VKKKKEMHMNGIGKPDGKYHLQYLGVARGYNTV
jgi:hypothetical protein